MATEKLSVILELITGNYKKEAREAATATSQIGTSARTAGTTAAGGFNLMRTAVVGLVGAGLVRWGSDTVDALTRIETIGAQTDAALRSTGGAANVTRADVDGLAGSLERLTSVEAESITEGQNLLLTFTNIRNEVGAGNDIFDRSTEAMVDLSVAMGQSIPGAAVLLGKAINDPLKGMTALTRAGVQFTAAQKTQIKGFIEANDIMSAQKIILEELNVQFGGSAEALGSTLQGRMDKVNHQWGEMSENLLTNLIPAIEGTVDWLDRFLRTIDDDRGPLRMKEALDFVVEALERGEEPSVVFANALNHVASAGAVSADELEQLATAAGITLSELDPDQLRAYGDELYLLAIAEGVAVEQAERLRDAVHSYAFELDAANPVTSTSIEGLGYYTSALKEAADEQWRLGRETDRTTDEIKAQNDEVRAAIDPLFALRSASEKNREAWVEYNIAVRDFGPASIEARDAALGLVDTQADLNYYAELYAANFGPGQEEAFRRVARQAGIAEEVIQRIIDSTNALNNKQVDIYFTMHESVRREAVENTRIGGKQHGGSVWKGHPYIVGEAGQELFIPGTSGSIVSNKQLMAALGRPNVTGGSITLVNPVTRSMPQDLQYGALLANHATFGKF